MVAEKPKNEEKVWQEFFLRQNLSFPQQAHLKAYYELLVRTNDIHNLTAITDVEKVISDHFEDSLALRNFINCANISMLGDIGTGAGFPALPLKIVFPHIKLVLIEVNHKKIDFLKRVVENLGLADVTITDLDWRTFLRKTSYPIDIFCARASLQPEELIRVFKPASSYKKSLLVYWASHYWQPSETVRSYIQRQETYNAGDKKRSLVFFSSNMLENV